MNKQIEVSVNSLGLDNESPTNVTLSCGGDSLSFVVGWAAMLRENIHSSVQSECMRPTNEQLQTALTQFLNRQP